MSQIISFGKTPVADQIEQTPQTRHTELHDLDLAFCRQCFLLQLSGPPVDLEKLFAKDYPYFSSYSSTLQTHAKRYAKSIINKHQLRSSDLVLEIASNDGYLLRHFLEQGIVVLGIDPASRQVDQARKEGIETRRAFFSQKEAQKLIRDKRHPKVIIANNVLAHLSDLKDFLNGIKALMNAGKSVAYFEVGYAYDLITKNQFDTIYHQHRCYFSLISISHLFGQYNLFVNDFEQNDMQGGSIRVFVEREPNPSDRLLAGIDREIRAGVNKNHFYSAFKNRVAAVREKIVSFIKAKRAQGWKFAGYGAAGKATTLIKYCHLNRSVISFIVDINPHKQGHYMPGTDIPIWAPSKIYETMPDCLVVFAWNYRDEIVDQLAPYIDQGGCLFIPLPECEVISKENGQQRWPMKASNEW